MLMLGKLPRTRYGKIARGESGGAAVFCSMMELDVDRILFLVYWLFVEFIPETKWMNEL